MTLEAVRGGQVSFQVVFRTGDTPVQVSAEAKSDLDVTIRRVGYVPVQHLSVETPTDHLEGVGHIPGLVPDPLLPESSFYAGVHETNAFWITVRIPTDVGPGQHPVTVTLTAEEESAALTARVNVHQAVLPPRRHFPITHWFYADALCDWYKVEPFEEAFWKIVEPYFSNYAGHGLDMVYVPMFTPPLDGNKRPTQLLDVTRNGDKYVFEWSLVKRWIDTAKEQGISRFEWTHLFRQWGVKNPVRIYHGSGGGENPLWPEETPATSPIYRDFLSQFLPEFKRFLDAEGLLDRSIFHISDEPHGQEHLENYRAAREMVRELAPWMKITEALSDIVFAKEGLVDTPIPMLPTAMDFAAEGIERWTYYCSAPRGKFLNRFLDTPLTKIRMSGWLFYKTQACGFLQWGYNYWYRAQKREMIDPYTRSDGGIWPHWSSGDPFVVYPGPDGPIDSIRWEIFAESLQDFALLQASGIDPDDPFLQPIRAYDDFPFEESWINQAHEKVLAKLDQL